MREFCLLHVRSDIQNVQSSLLWYSVSFSFQRIEVCVKQNNFLDALELALSFYNGTAMAVIGNNRELNGAVSQDLSKIQTVETVSKLSETKIIA